MIRAPAAAAAAVLAALTTLGACSSNASTNADDPSSATTPSEEMNTAPTQTPHGAYIVGEIAEGDLTPGRYALPAIGPLDEPLAVFDVPAGYSTFGPFIEADKPAESEDPLMLGLWVVTGVYLNPCMEANEVPASNVLALFNALAEQRLTSSTRAREFDLAGYHGIYVEVTTPTDLDYSTCNDAELNLWEGRPDGGYWTRMPGMVEKLWVLDVEGRTMVIHMAVPPSATGPQIHAMTKIVESATFETPDAA